MLLDANILIYAVDEDSPFHESTRSWLEETLNGSRRVGIPWWSLYAFLRIATNPRALDVPLRSADAWAIADAWLDVPVVWNPEPGLGHRAVLGELVRKYELRANQIPDAALAALAIEHGLTVVSTDTDFARFTEIGWHNPLSA